MHARGPSLLLHTLPRLQSLSRMSASSKASPVVGAAPSGLPACLVIGKDGALRVNVQVKPNCKAPSFYLAEDGSLELRLTAPPRDGEANAELIETLSDVFRVPKSSMAVTAGFKSRSKTVTIAGLDADTAARVLSAASDKK